MSYVIGVSSGIFGAASQEERMQYVTLSQKAQYVLTQGVKFNQIDIESMAEFKEPNIQREVDQVKRLGISFGFHGESGAFGGREVPVKLDSAIEDDYIRSHERVIETFTQAAKLGGKYYLLHSSETEPFIMLGQHMQPSKLVDFWGRPLKNLLEYKEKEGEEKRLAEELMKWVIDSKREFVWEYTRISPTELSEERTVKEQADRILSDDSSRWNLLNAGLTSDMDPITRQKLTEERRKELEKEIAELARDMEAAREKWKERLKNYLEENIKTFVDRRDMAFGPERIAYYLIAKYMEFKKDPLWTDIVRASVKFNLDAYPDKYSPAERMTLANEEGWTIDNKEFRERTELWVPAVSAKYIWGHLNPADERRYADPKKILAKDKMYFVIETPMAAAGMENLMRMSNPVQFYYLVKHVSFEYFRYAFDAEHILGNYLDPMKVIEHLPEDGGAYLKVVHLGWPTAIQPAHMPIYVGSKQHQYLYEMLFNLRKKGFTCDKGDGYLIYERGSAPIQQSVIAMKLVLEFLEKDTDPKKLPTKFYGVAMGEMTSEERQGRVIDEHARDPLRGLLAIPEEEYTFLSRSAMAKPGGAAEKWKKEELR